MMLNTSIKFFKLVLASYTLFFNFLELNQYPKCGYIESKSIALLIILNVQSGVV